MLSLLSIDIPLLQDVLNFTHVLFFFGRGLRGFSWRRLKQKQTHSEYIYQTLYQFRVIYTTKSEKEPKILTFSTRRQNPRNGVLDLTTTAKTRVGSSRVHAW